MKQCLILAIIICQIPFSFSQVVNVSTAAELQTALSAATPGQIITLADRIYVQSGGFKVTAGINGTKDAPIKLIGSSNVVVSSNNLSTGYGLWLKGNNYWIIEGFTIYNSFKGIILDNSYHDIISNVTVKKIGDEGIHLRTFSSFDTIQNCLIDSTGLTKLGYGEGIYIGSAKSNWSTYSGGNPDTCNYNVVRGNSFGNQIESENIDIKEGTTGGLIINNNFNGTGVDSVNSADSWIDVKGNHYTIECNTGKNTGHKIADGIQTHIQLAGWGNYNTFSNNTMDVSGPGYAIKVQTTGSSGTATQNIICTSNTVTNATSGLTNVATQECTSTCDSIYTEEIALSVQNEFKIYPNPVHDILQINFASEKNNILEFNLVDLQGKVIITETQNTGKGIYSLNTKSISKGIYFLKINTSGVLYKVVKVVKE